MSVCEALQGVITMSCVSPGAQIGEAQDLQHGWAVLTTSGRCFILPPLAGLNETQTPSPVVAEGTAF